MKQTLELGSRREGELVLLVSPAVGLFTCALPAGAALVAGAPAGVLVCLGRAASLFVPAGIAGRVEEPASKLVVQPVGYGDVLYKLAPLALGAGDAALRDSDVARAGLAVRAPYAGRFFGRPAPSEPAFVSPGDVLEAGRPVGLIEVMKTFTQVRFTPGSGLPERVRVLCIRALDGAEVHAGDALVEVEPV